MQSLPILGQDDAPDVQDLGNHAGDPWPGPYIIDQVARALNTASQPLLEFASPPASFWQ